MPSAIAPKLATKRIAKNVGDTTTQGERRASPVRAESRTWFGRSTDPSHGAQSHLFQTSITGTEATPSKVGISVADIAAGMYAYSGILTALIVRAKTSE